MDEKEQGGEVCGFYNEDLTHKTILVGDSGVGKTSLLVQFDQGKFIPGSFSATVGIGFTNKVVTVADVKVKLQIWDTAGQERFRSVTHAYYRDAHALLLLYDITSKSSFDNIRAWLTEIHEYAQSDVVIMLLGNKADMGNGRVIKREDGERLAREHGVIFMETSAKTGINVDLAFMTVAKFKTLTLVYKDKHRPAPSYLMVMVKARELIGRSVEPATDPKFQIHDMTEMETPKTSCCGFT